MNEISVLKKSISIVLKIIVIVSVIVGVLLSAGAGRRSFMGGSVVFMYFTIQSNIAIAVVCIAGLCILLRKKTYGAVWYTVKLVMTVSITLTGVVFGFVLAPTLGKNAWNIQNILTHVVVPVAAVIDFFVVAGPVRLRMKSALFVIIPPLLYAIYAGIGYIQNWEFSTGKNYPYFFLNWGSPAGAFGFTDGLPYMGSAWWILALLIFLIAVGFGYIALANKICKKSNVKE